MTVSCYQTCYTNSTEGSIHESIWKNQQPPTVFLQDAKNHKYWTAARHYAHYRSNTNNKLTFFQKVFVFSDAKQSFKPWPIVLFGILLLRLDTNSSHAHSRQALQSTKTTLLCPTYTLQAGEFFHQDLTTI